MASWIKALARFMILLYAAFIATWLTVAYPRCLDYSKEVMQSLQEEVMTGIAKVTAKGQTTIPREIRSALKIKPGDLIAWEVDSRGHVEVRRVQPMDVEYLRALEGTLSEWSAPEDEEAYRDL